MRGCDAAHSSSEGIGGNRKPALSHKLRDLRPAMLGVLGAATEFFVVAFITPCCDFLHCMSPVSLLSICVAELERRWRTEMLVKDYMSKPVTCCKPWDTVWTAAALMKTHAIGALPVVLDIEDPLLEGIVTDRDLCCAVLTSPKASCPVRVIDAMTRLPVTCHPNDTLEECQELMRENQVRRLPVVNDRGRCVGIIALADVARYAPALELTTTISEISQPQRPHTDLQLNGGYFHCGQLHDLDQIALLDRRREQTSRQEVLA
jgi:CBS domain-containing protein